MKLLLSPLYVPAQCGLVRVFWQWGKCTLLATGLSVASFTLNAQTVSQPDAIVSESEDSALQASEEQSASAAGEQGDENAELSDGTEPSTTRPAMTSWDWLERMTQSTRQLNFQIAFVQSQAGQETVPYLWRHGVLENGVSMEQLSLQNGPGRELIRVGDVVSVFEPDVPPYSLRSNVINGPIPSELLYTPESLRRGYEFVTVGRARIAGRPAQQIRIVSRDNSRFSYQLWLDEQTGMPLKLNMLDLQGTVLEQIQVTSLVILDQPHEYFARVNQASLPRPMAITPKQPRQHQWEVDYLPKGMVEVRRDIRRLALTGQVVEYKMFSDGLVDVSVYVQPAGEALGSDLVLRQELNTFLTLTDGQAQVTVVGEIPLQTANAIATSLRLKEGQ